MNIHFKGKLEDENIILRNKVSSLQLDLENSEAVQKDFVTLSQSLQIQLEKIRQSDSEVRWQHEEDVHDCNNCKKKLNSRRDKVRQMLRLPLPNIAPAFVPFTESL